MSYAISLVGVTPLGILVSHAADAIAGKTDNNITVNFLINLPLFNEPHHSKILVFMEFLI